MRRKFSLLLTLTAWLLATGSQWDAVQTFAWARMFAANAQVLPFGDALARTFAPENRCHLCLAVAKAKEQQEQGEGAAAVGKSATKIVLVFQPASDVFVAPPDSAPWPAGFETAVSTGRGAPPLPPPRVLAV